MVVWASIIKILKLSGWIQTRKEKFLGLLLKILGLSILFSGVLFIHFNLFFVQGGSIIAANYYPEDGNTYEFVDHFTSQVTAVNVNTTISVSIDGESPMPMNDYGIRHEMAPGDITARDWFTWEISVPAITTPGNHTFQFFNHYYVWQQADQNWAEYASYSNIKSFTISEPNSTSSAAQLTEITSSQDLQTIIILSLIIGVIALIILVIWWLKQPSKKMINL